MKKVIIKECYSYDEKKIKKILEEMIKELNFDLNKFKSILIKPNVLGPYEPEQCVTTNPKLLEAICSMINPKTKIFICDSSGTDIQNYTEKSFEISKIKSLENRFKNVKVISFNTMKLIKINSSSKYLNGFYLPKILKDIDLIINVPKLKTHTFMILTAGIKNLFGCIPGGAKAKLHKICKNSQNFAKMLLELHEIIKPQLNIVDGIWGMEGNGPSLGKPKQFGRLFVSKNALALDIVIAKALGFEQKDVPVNQLIKKRGLSFKDLKISGIDKLNLECKKPISIKKMNNFLPAFIKKSLYELKLKINPQKCKRCQICLKSCPVQAIYKKNNRILINHQKCIMCHCCYELCPYGAVEFKDRFLRSLIKKFKKIIN
ncbi:MAG: DUF362 domain-containing protein [Nanoarchaeota archaeon]|nr:DUF362 domain-containing protein [Nanoarchaeota archaeon]